MKIFVAFAVLLLIRTNAFILENRKTSQAVASDLQGFPDFVGDSFGEDKAKTFLNLINVAATLHRDDMQKNLKYLQTNMQAAYGQGNQTFSVIIQSNSTQSLTNSFVYNSYGDTYAAFSTGVSLINPTWSYMCYILQRKSNWSLQYVPHSGQGININTGTINAIKSIILKRDGTGKCLCRHSSFIQLDLSQYDSQTWNVVCHSEPITEGYVLVRDKQWVSAKPYSCYYMIFAI